MASMLRVFISCVPRVEFLLQQELEALLPGRRWDRKHGGIEGRVSSEELWLLSHDLRIAESIRIRVGDFSAPNFESLMEGIQRIPWSVYFRRDEMPSFDVSCSRSALYHTEAITERLRGFFVARGASERAEGGREVHVRLIKDVAQVSVNATGEPLYRRGFRTVVHRAPLRETYAAACLRASGLSSSMALADPFCGSGVFLTERLTLKGGFTLPRRFSFEGWPTHDANAYKRWCGDRGGFEFPESLQLWGGDLSVSALSTARVNLSKFGSLESIHLKEADASDFLAVLDPSVDVLCNPPWGLRVRGSFQVGAEFGAALKRRPKEAPGQVFVLVSGRRFLESTGVRWAPVLEFQSGGLPVVLARYLAF